jgi:hypothetical protein
VFLRAGNPVKLYIVVNGAVLSLFHGSLSLSLFAYDDKHDEGSSRHQTEIK